MLACFSLYVMINYSPLFFEWFQDDDHGSEQIHRSEADRFDEEGEEDESDADDFIVDDEGRPIAEKRKKRKPIFNDA